MSKAILQLGNASNWESVYTVSKQVTVINANTYNPIAEFDVPFLLDRDILAILVTSASAKETWRFAGMLYQKTFLGIAGIGGIPDADSVSRRKIWLNRVQLVVLPHLSAEYSISFAPPYWMKDLNFYIWKYIGLESDTTEQSLAELQQTTNRIEAKLNDGVYP